LWKVPSIRESFEEELFDDTRRYESRTTRIKFPRCNRNSSLDRGDVKIKNMEGGFPKKKKIEGEILEKTPVHHAFTSSDRQGRQALAIPYSWIEFKTRSQNYGTT